MTSNMGELLIIPFWHCRNLGGEQPSAPPTLSTRWARGEAGTWTTGTSACGSRTTSTARQRLGHTSSACPWCRHPDRGTHRGWGCRQWRHLWFWRRCRPRWWVLTRSRSPPGTRNPKGRGRPWVDRLGDLKILKMIYYCKWFQIHDN